MFMFKASVFFFCLRWCLPFTRTRVLPYFCPNTEHPKEKVLHSLDVVSALWVFQNPTALFQESDVLFFHTVCLCKEPVAS